MLPCALVAWPCRAEGRLGREHGAPLNRAADISVYRRGWPQAGFGDTRYIIVLRESMLAQLLGAEKAHDRDQSRDIATLWMRRPHAQGAEPVRAQCGTTPGLMTGRPAAAGCARYVGTLQLPAESEPGMTRCVCAPGATSSDIRVARPGAQATVYLILVRARMGRQWAIPIIGAIQSSL